MAAASRKRKLPSDFHYVESTKRLKISEQEITFLEGNPYPDNFYVGQAIGNGSCFFDSFRQGLEQQKGTQVTVQQLRMDCKKFAKNNPPEWFIVAIGNDFDEVKREFVNRGITRDQYVNSIEKNTFWGRPDIEGRILCEKYKVNLHISEYNSGKESYKHTVSGPKYTRKIYSSKVDEIAKRNPREVCSVSMDGAKAYKLDNTIHIINKGHAHFEPLLDRKKSLAKQEQEDFQLAKQLQVDEILEYCNISKDSPARKEVEGRFDELLAKNADGEINVVVGQCVSDIEQRIKCSEEPNSLNSPNCGVEEIRIEKAFHQQQAPQQLIKSS